MKNITLHQMSWALDRIAGSQCMSEEAQAAAGRAGELLRAVRAALDLEWDSEAADLHRIGLMVEPSDQLRQFLEQP